MTLTTLEVLERYNISSSHLWNKRRLIEERGALVHKNLGGSDGNLYDSDVLDALALEDGAPFGSKAKKAILNINQGSLL